jgi:undecaprenyl-diphosphatase
MKKLNWKNITILLGIISVIYIIMLKTIDVRPIGPYHTKVGFAAINNFVHIHLPKNIIWYNITKYLGYLTFILVIYYAIIGLKQLLKGKSLKKVDKKILLLGAFYILVGIVYVIFEKIVINYRPVLMDGELEASFPSSHTMLALCVCGSSLLISKYYLKNKQYNKILNIITWIIMIILVVGRLISGVHWFTDIIGGILISMFLLSLFYTNIEKEKGY